MLYQNRSKLQINSLFKEKQRDKHLINEIYFDTKSSCTYFVILIFHYNSCNYNNNIYTAFVKISTCTYNRNWFTIYTAH